MVDSSQLRVADSDRELLAQELREHMLAGRLSAEEFEQRVDLAYKAITRAELDALRADLPMGIVTLEGELAKRKVKLRRRLIQEGAGGLGISAVCVLVWLVDGAGGGFWPAWVMLVTLLPVLRNAWRLVGPDPDLESVEAHLNARRRRALARERRHAHHRSLPR
jgi:hypothetical protein